MKRDLVFGPYDELYASVPNNILWDSKPSHLLQKLASYMTAGEVLDVGCGDGVNSLFLETSGFSVKGIDISRLALTGLRNRFANSKVQLRGTYDQMDIHQGLPRSAKYDVIVSCGLYQCLNKETRHAVHADLHAALITNGVILFSCLTNSIPLPRDHLTDSIELVDISEVKHLFRGMSIDYFREGVIFDRHGTRVSDHQHSVVWVVARKGA